MSHKGFSLELESLEPIPHRSMDPDAQEVEREAEPFAGFNRAIGFFSSSMFSILALRKDDDHGLLLPYLLMFFVL